MTLQTIENDLLALVEAFDGNIAYKMETDLGDVIGYQEGDRFQSASLIKIPMIIEGYLQSERKKIYLNQPVTIPPNAVTGGSGVLHALSNKVFLTVEDLLTLMITVSDNTATNMMMDLLGFDEINRCIKELGLKNTFLGRKMQDFQALKDGKDNTISAEDTVTCLKAIHTGDFLTKQSQEKILRVFENQQLRDKLPSMMGRGVKVASKTGGIRGVSHDCAIIRSESRMVYAAVLTENIKSDEESRQVISKIGKLIYDDMVAE
ncbi:serine hydrolase [Peribacillus sp. SI8-4]|uniref:serine hydrolase n=1 Tax=Peribacillus sp. SI8-4 TaxID=3048009 RepID=UPI00255358D6|nr:serine hydrolase [Peribacillus sp. SI8-4]